MHRPRKYLKVLECVLKSILYPDMIILLVTDKRQYEFKNGKLMTNKKILNQCRAHRSKVESIYDNMCEIDKKYWMRF